MFWKNEPAPSKFGNKMIPAVKQFIIFLVGWVGFRVFAASVEVAITVFASLEGLDGTALLNTPNMAMIVNSACYIALLIAVILITNFDIVKLLKSFKQYQSYIAGIICLLSMFAFNILYGLFLTAVGLKTSNNANESSIENITKLYGFASIVIFGIIGPICEEFTYRVGLFSLLQRKSKWLAYLLTIVIFASIHFNISFNPTELLNEVLNLPYYMFAAFAFSFTYEKFGLAGSLTAHILNNLISLSLVSIIH